MIRYEETITIIQCHIFVQLPSLPRHTQNRKFRSAVDKQVDQSAYGARCMEGCKQVQTQRNMFIFLGLLPPPFCRLSSSSCFSVTNNIKVNNMPNKKISLQATHASQNYDHTKLGPHKIKTTKLMWWRYTIILLKQTDG